MVAINWFVYDSEEEFVMVEVVCVEKGVKVAWFDGWVNGGEGICVLVEVVVEFIENGNIWFKFLYEWNMFVKEKIKIIVIIIYGVVDVVYSWEVECDLWWIWKFELEGLLVCIVKM